ncbi:MAG: RNA polymerase sigma factor, partial [Planctomycetota bacterium JB042]
MPADGVFPSTCWSRIRPGDGAGDGAQREAVAALARSYDGPIRAYLRAALGRSPHDADDLAQEFFAWALESGFLAKADPSRGRFRGFLKVALRNFVRDAGRRERALVRGGGRRTVPIASGHHDDEGGPPRPRRRSTGR